jgi:transposase
VSVCVRRAQGTKTETDTQRFGTFTADLERLREYLRRQKVRRVVMESTGVYWMPVWNVLERGSWKFDLVLVNPQHVRALPGRKTDQADCERLAELGQYDLLRGSFIPPQPQRELRDLTRRRTHLQRDRNRIINRIGRLLETANLKLSSVVSDLVGKTGWLILNQIADGESDPYTLAELAQGRLQSRKTELAASLHGYVTPHFRWLLRQLLDELVHLDRELERFNHEIRQRMHPHGEAIARLCSIPGVDEITAWTIIAELGTDMNRFPDAAHAVSWAGLCPGNCESAGKRFSGRTRKGDRYLRCVLIQNAWAVAHKKNCFLTALFYRIASRRGSKRAAMAVAHRVLTIAYCILRDGTVYREAGADYFDRLHPERTARRLIRRLQNIGYFAAPAQDAPAPIPANLPPRPGTLRWHKQPVRRREPDTRPPATREECKQCAAWGIPCLHLSRQLKSKRAEATSPPVSSA